MCLLAIKFENWSVTCITTSTMNNNNFFYLVQYICHICCFVADILQLMYVADKMF